MPVSKSLAGVDLELATRIRMLLSLVPGAWVESALRTFAQQTALYKAYLAGGTLAAKPGTSMHEKGLAVDVDYHDYAHLVKTAKQCGLCQPIKGEPWHQQLDPNRVPLDSQVFPTITTLDNGEVDMANLKTITYSNVELDKNGCGWVPVAADADKIIGQPTQQGSYPPADGYWNICKFAKQSRNLGGGNLSVVEITGGLKKQIITFYVQVAP